MTLRCVGLNHIYIEYINISGINIVHSDLLLGPSVAVSFVNHVSFSRDTYQIQLSLSRPLLSATSRQTCVQSHVTIGRKYGKRFDFMRYGTLDNSIQIVHFRVLCVIENYHPQLIVSLMVD